MVYPLPSLVTVLPAPRPSDPSPGLPGVPPLTNSDRTVRAGSGSTCCPSSSARLTASDIQILLLSGPQGPGPDHLIVIVDSAYPHHARRRTHDNMHPFPKTLHATT